MRTFVVAIVAPSTLFREGLSRILRGARIEFLSAATIDRAFCDCLSQKERVVLLVGASGESAYAAAEIAAFKNELPEGRVAVISDRTAMDRTMLEQMTASFKAGAHGFFHGTTSGDVLIKGLEMIAFGQAFVPLEALPMLVGGETESPIELSKPKWPSTVETRFPGVTLDAPKLSKQESRILDHLVRGDSNKVIARAVDITEATVKVHIKAILRKIRVRNRTQAAVWASSARSAESAVEEAGPGNSGRGEMRGKLLQFKTTARPVVEASGGVLGGGTTPPKLSH